MPPIIGIDLGTTNSLVAYVDYRTGLPRVIPDRREQVLVPSIVSFTSEGPVVGDEADACFRRSPDPPSSPPSGCSGGPTMTRRNTTIPTRAEETFTTAVDGQTTIALHVVQGQGGLAEECRSLARFELRGIPPMTAGVLGIRATFWIDAEGLLRVEATERHAPAAASIICKPTHGPHEAEITRILASVRPEGGIECS